MDGARDTGGFTVPCDDTGLICTRVTVHSERDTLRMLCPYVHSVSSSAYHFRCKRAKKHRGRKVTAQPEKRAQKVSRSVQRLERLASRMALGL